MPRTMSTGQAARTVERSRKTIQNWIEKGYFEAWRLGGRWQIDAESFMGFVRQAWEEGNNRKIG